MKTVKLILLLLLFCTSYVNAQNQLKVMAYNLLNYPSSDTNIRNPYFRTVINAADPDILVVSEINTLTGVSNFLNHVLNFSSPQYTAGWYINGPDTDNALFFKSSKVNFMSNTAITTSLRNINEFIITDKIYNDTLRIFAVHLKAGDTDVVRRAGEVDSLRKRTNTLAPGSNFIVLGDFNIYGSGELAYQKLIQDNVTDDGNFNDPLNMTGTWNSFSYAPYHTQSTRTRNFGNGATGGLDDRFDMILHSRAVKNTGGIRFVPGSYTAFGNDGGHYNDSINKAPNNAVGQITANALHYASDHLPVLAVYEFGSSTVMNLRVTPEGLYDNITNRLSRKDTAFVYLRNVNVPYAILDSSKGRIDSLTFTSSLNFRKASTGSYYIMVKHLNSIETWSKTGYQYSIDSVNNYDFTNSVTKAFGDNLKLKGVKYCIFSGDANRDGIVDSEDITDTYADALSFQTGYLSTDMNGDYFTDADDVTIVYNNSVMFVSKVVP